MTTPVGTNRELGVANATSMSKFVTFNYTSAVVSQGFFVAPFPCLITDITGRVTTAGTDGSAVTFTFRKAPSGTAITSGTALCTGTFNVKGTAATNQQMTLVTNQDTLTLAQGDTVGLVLSGTATSAVGSITVTIEPIS